MIHVTSAAGVLALLEDPEPKVKVFSLQRLDTLVDSFWPEISESIDKIEILYEDKSFDCGELAALVASKVYYHLGSYEDSLTFALGAGQLFNVNDTSLYVETIIAKCIDHYTKLRVSNYESDDDTYRTTIDPRLETIVNRMFERCFHDRQYTQAVGIAIETRRLDILEKAIGDSDDKAGMLTYCLKVCLSLIESRAFRNTILEMLVRLYLGLPTPDYISMCQCYIFLDDAQSCADILEKLVKSGDHDSVLMAYQIGFDLYDSATQKFIHKVQASIRACAPIPLTSSTGGDHPLSASSPIPESSQGEDDSTAATEGSDSGQTEPRVLTDSEEAVQSVLKKLDLILCGEYTINLHLQFLIKNNKTDMLILKNTKDAVRNSVCHSATVIANAYMHCGTTSDQFLRDNLEWLAKSTNWAKFTATASLGVVHKGHENDALSLMAQYLPRDSTGGSPYSEGGGLYALGLIHTNHGANIMEYLLNQLKDATDEQNRHGGCLALGLAAMSTERSDVYEQLKSNLYLDDAVAGEAAGIAMGLVMLGSKSAGAIEDMVTYAKESQHEKILRGLAVGIALTMYGREEEADPLIDSLQKDKDPILRWSAMYTIAMAYAGTGNNQAIRKLLHIAVSDVNDDVRRTAVTSLGFLLFRTPEQCPSVVSLLSESYNSHVRYGAAMALGIACAGTGLKEAMLLLEPLINDSVNYVRQAALIASALVLIQQTEHTSTKVKSLRETFAKVISDKHEDVMAKFGAILAQGIIDAGGRNMTVALQSRTGHMNMEAVVGLLVFQQFWYWFPLSHFLSLAFSPTAIIGLNSDLKMPEFEVVSNARPSIFGYPPKLEEKKDKSREKVETAVLSITARQKKKKGERVPSSTDTTVDSNRMEKMDTEEKKEEKKETKSGDEKKPAKEKEPSLELLSNPSRVMRQQLKVLSLPSSCRYTTVKPITTGGILLLKDSQPGTDEKLVEIVKAGGPKKEADEDEGVEPEAPEPFEWPEDI
ncbi:26S proteasome non-ATPase regulatory subunit 1-like [Watersipora subatra]|uniref:26S proteasome non-ATPase regulatory subunit 1-like n=1 Tax=Watersipora subatra TaxID=2589382 RepID=UPI00355C4420